MGPCACVGYFGPLYSFSWMSIFCIILLYGDDLHCQPACCSGVYSYTGLLGVRVIQDSLSPVHSNSKVNRSASYCTWVQICIVIMRWPCQQKERIVMKAIRFIPTGIHAYFDYIGGIT